MSNVDHIKADVVAAMKSGQPLKLSVLRMLLSALNYKQIELQHDLSEEEVLTVIGNEAKKRREAIASYQVANRSSQAAQEQQELEILQAYLPAQLSEEEVREEIKKLRDEEIKGITDFGQVMKVVSPLFRGRADGNLVAGIVKELVSS